MTLIDPKKSCRKCGWSGPLGVEHVCQSEAVSSKNEMQAALNRWLDEPLKAGDSDPRAAFEAGFYAGRGAAETPADALRVLAEVRRRVHEMKERHVPGLFTDEMARIGELMATVLGPESQVKTEAPQAPPGYRLPGETEQPK